MSNQTIIIFGIGDTSKYHSFGDNSYWLSDILQLQPQLKDLVTTVLEDFGDSYHFQKSKCKDFENDPDFECIQHIQPNCASAVFNSW